MRPRNLIFIGLAVLLAGCSDPFGPADVDGVYQLERIGDDPLPAVLFSNDHYTLRVLSDTMILYANGTGTIFSVQEGESLDEGFEPSGPIRVETPIGFRVRSDRIEIEFYCPPNAMCVQGPHITAWKTGDRLHARYFALETPLIYSRVADAPDRQRWRP